MSNKLHELADKIGILTKFRDAGLVAKDYEVNDDVIAFLAGKLGYKADDNASIVESINKFNDRRWHKVLNGIYVVKPRNVVFDIVLPKSAANEILTVSIANVDTKASPTIRYEVESLKEEKRINGNDYVKLFVRINSDLDIGYYDLYVNAGSEIYSSRLAVAPDRCYESEVVNNSKLWGVAVQLYSLKSKRNWGVGDLTDLETLIDICGSNGASVIGLNPLNVLFHDYPENASPYSSISRLFSNPIYIDAEKVPEFLPEDKTEIEDKLKKYRDSETILYSYVYPTKMAVLEKAYKRFKDSANKERKLDFSKYLLEKGSELDKLAIFQCLYEEKSKVIWGGWRAWEEEYKNPHSPKVAEYVKENQDRIGFFKFLQFEFDRQLNGVHGKIKEKNLAVGLYRDLAVGVGGDSAELWGDSGTFIEGAGAGAPPDAFFPAGQKWGLGAFNPFRLEDAGYEPFIKILRANMKFSGALRIDHVMSLMRLYIIPDHKELGTYVLYNLDEMMAVVMIESHLNKCMIVGESIGNVPDGFLDKLGNANIKSLSVLWAERYGAGWGDFIPPDKYPVDSYVSVGTHDMAPLKMWWFGYDIELSYNLGLIPNEQEKNNSYHKRENDRWKLLSALDYAGVWPRDNMRSGNYIYGEKYPEGIEEAVHRFMSRTNSKVFLAQLEDILQVEKLQNLPGTDRDKHPNWRRKIPVDLEDLEDSAMFVRNIKAIKMER
ncbi:MAG: 4-alpha-glucanotransferase [Lactobacillaceae bacterium]|jgi:4-alpha-glucanotransferase|nr:4-alpha-glucanotransferase [Lactobacillaceae bacterium]